MPVTQPAPLVSEAQERLIAAWRELRRGAAARDMQARLFGRGPDSLEPGQVDTLAALAEKDTWRMSELAAELRVDPSTATRIVAPLIQRGLVARATDPTDGRGIRVMLTPAGRIRYDEMAARSRGVWDAMLADFSLADLNDLTELMERLVDGLNRVASDASDD